MKVVFSRAAKADLADIHGFWAIARDNSQTAKRIVIAIRRSTERLAFWPYSGRRGAKPNTYEVVVREYPYIVVCRVLTDVVQIIAVFRASQDIPRGG